MAITLRALRAFACMLAAIALPGTAGAGSLRVDPVRLEISADRRSATLTISNVEQAPVTIRAYPLAWRQVDGEDRYEESSALIVSPPVFTIPAGGTQIVRIGLRSPAAARNAYRLMVEEVPEARAEGGIRVALRLNLPLFAMIDRGSSSQLSWRAWRQPDRSWVVEATNRGATYVRVAPAEAAAATGVQLDGAANLVVLPDSSRRWVIGEQPEFIDRARFTSIIRASDNADTRFASSGN